MSLQPGTRLGVYSITGQLGEGGMGQVYRATDTTLGRPVAIKMLPAAFAADAERVARFEREAKTLASLNHPHIAAIYGFENTASGHALIMELVEGEDLADRLRAGPLPPAEALSIATQIADAIADAHEHGIVHRDLKPANIKVTPDGVVKVLDFGLAKAMDGGVTNRSGSIDIEQSPTMTSPAMTQAGVILGTAAYMSPEQAKGRIADKRSDIWSFGCVLFEMLTGQKAFAGEDVSETLAAILRAEPDLAQLPPGTPQHLRAIIDGCLKKDRKQRFSDIAVVQHLLNGPAAVGSVPSAPASALWKAAAVIFGVTTIAALGVPAMVRQPAALPEIDQFVITAPPKAAFVTAGRTGSTPAISPDGRRLAYTLRDGGGSNLIWIRPLNLLDAQPLRGTDRAEFPFWSPDGRSLGFFADNKLKRIDVDGGPAQIVCDAPGARGGSWNSQGDIVVGGIAGSTTGSGLSRVSMTGGELKRFTTAGVGDHRFPSFLPDGRHLMFYWQAPGAKETGLYLSDIDSGQLTRIADADTSAVYAEPGVILFGRQSALFEQPFDLTTLKTTGPPVSIADGLETGVFAGIIAFSVSRDGTLVYGIGSARSSEVQVTWYDRQGKALSTVGVPGNYMGVELSPDGKQLAVHRHENTIGGDLWTLDLQRGSMSRLTFEPVQDNSSPVWTPDNHRIVFTSLRNSDFGIYVKASNGAGGDERFTVDGVASPRSLSRDGKWLFYVTGGASSDIWVAPFDGSAKPTALLNSQYNEIEPALSPDRKWLAYASDETGQMEIYVRPFPMADGKWQVSTAGGQEPRWRADSKELFFLDRPQLGAMMSADVHAAVGAFATGAPRELFRTNLLMFGHPGPQGWWKYDVSADGQRFIMPVNPRSSSFGDASSSPIVVMLNWAGALKKAKRN